VNNYLGKSGFLAKTFLGQLVPTEAELTYQEGRDYEPASVLLDRIRAGRALVNTKGLSLYQGKPIWRSRSPNRLTLRGSRK
jgi:hypothetical protein